MLNESTLKKPMRSMMRAVLFALVAALAVAVTCDEPVEAQNEFDVSVDAGREIGGFRPIFGVTCGPASPRPGWWDFTWRYHWVRVKSVRIHDCQEVGDVHTVFPNPNGDPLDPNDYDFKEIDRVMAAIDSAGFHILYRLGHSWGTGHRGPADFDRYALICEHIVKHFTQGWAGGFFYKNIEWEVWNEANLSQSWNQSASNFYRFYDKVAAAVRRADPSARVGTCALAVNWPGDFQEGLIEECVKQNTPLDFFSWHYYGWDFDQPQPYDFTRQAQWIRHLLDKHGLTNAKNYLTEWNVWHPGNDPRIRNLDGATYVLSAAMFMHDSALDLAHHYRGDVCDAPCGGLFFAPKPDYAPTLRADAFHLLAQLEDTPTRIEAEGGDRSGFAVLAGKSDRVVQVLLSNWWSPAPARELHVTGLSKRARRLEVFEVGKSGLGLVETRDLAPADRFDYDLPQVTPWNRLVRLTERGGEDFLLTSDAGNTSNVEPRGRLRLHAPQSAGRQYALVFGVTGDAPGTSVGAKTIPVNLDAMSFWVLTQLGKPGYDQLVGTLDNAGDALVDFRFFALDPQLVGGRLTVAAVLYDAGGVRAVSNAVSLKID